MQDNDKFEKIELLSVLQSISKEIGENINGYLIGGLAMIFHGTKISTKDVDIVFTTEKEAGIFENAAVKSNFYKDNILTDENNKLGARTVLRSPEGYSFDIFVDIICRGLILSDNMRERSKQILSMEKMTLFAVSLEDIFLFKSITDRPDDLADMAMIAGAGIDWKYIEDEIRSQPDNWKWIPLYYAKLNELESKHDIVSPSKKRFKEEAEISMGINIILSHIEKGPIRSEELPKILNEDDKFIEKILKKMTEYKLIELIDNTIMKI